MARRKKIGTVDNNPWGFNPRELSSEQKKQYLKKIVERANKRLYRIEKSGNYSYAASVALRELKTQNRKRFSYRLKTDKEILSEIYKVESFLNMESSLVSNIKKIQQKAFETLSKRLKNESNIDLEGVRFNKTAFYDFLNSQQFKDLAAEYGSDWVVEDMVRAMETNKLSVEEVVEEYKEFMKTDLPLEAVRLKREGAISSYAEYEKRRRKPKL